MSNRGNSSVASLQLRKAVDWKIFEIQSVLISEEVNADDLDESILWLQPRHFQEVVEERTNDGRCGYPLCRNSLNAPSSSEPSGKYRIVYHEKRVYEVGSSAQYCSDQCYEKNSLFEKRFESSLPYSRQVVLNGSLDLTSRRDSNIDDVLELLSSKPVNQQVHPGPNSNLLSKPAGGAGGPTPPVFSNPVLGSTGDARFELKDGLPISTASSTSFDSETPVVRPKGSASSRTAHLNEADAQTTREDKRQDPLEEAGIGVEYTAQSFTNRSHNRGSPSGSPRSPVRRKMAAAVDSQANQGSKPAAVPADVVNFGQLERDINPTREGRYSRRTTEGGSDECSLSSTPADADGSTATASDEDDDGKARATEELTGSARAGRPQLSLPPAPRSGVTSSVVAASASHKDKKDDLPIQEIFATMHALRAKYTSSNGKQFGDSGVRITDSVDVANNQQGIKKNSAAISKMGLVAKGQSSIGKKVSDRKQKSDSAGSMGPRPGPKTVSWAEPPPRSVLGGAVAKHCLKGTASQSSRRGMAMDATAPIMERTGGTPLPASALLTKQLQQHLPTDAPVSLDTLHIGNYNPGGTPNATGLASTINSSTTKATKAAADVMGPDEQAETDTALSAEGGADVDPSEAALSIDGYVAEMRRSMRVSAGTVLSGLSYHPFERQRTRQKAAVAASTSVAVKTASKIKYAGLHEGGGQAGEPEASRVGSESQEVHEVSADTSGDDSSGDEGSIPSVGIAGAKGYAMPDYDNTLERKSCFLRVWTALDDLFGPNCIAALHIAVGVRNELTSDPPLPPPPDEAAEDRTAIGDESSAREGLHYGLAESSPECRVAVESLERGMAAAEEMLGVHSSMPGQGHIETYGLAKLQLLASVRKSCQAFLDRGSQVSAGAWVELYAEDWPFVGLLVVDALVLAANRVYKSEQQVQAQSQSFQPGVSSGSWDSKVEAVGITLTRERGSDLQLREGDLTALRGFFQPL